MSDPIDDAVEVITRTMFGLTTPSMARDIAHYLHAADLLVTPARDAAVAAKALREAAAFVDEYAYKPSDVEKPPSGQERAFYLGATEAHRVAYRLLNERAYRIEASHE